MKYCFSLFIVALALYSVPAQAQITQKIKTVAGNGYGAFAGDGGYAMGASLWGPRDVAVDKAGNLYICDFYNNRIRKVTPAGMITTIIGSGGTGNSGNGSIATSANLTPYGMALDKKGNIFMADASIGVVRKINTSFIITPYAGDGYVPGYSGDGGPATVAKMRVPQGLAVDAVGNLYIADAGNHCIRMVDTFGVISTVAGIDTAGYTGDGGLAVEAKLDSPVAVAVDLNGTIYINDYNNNVIRRIDTGVITTYVGDPTVVYGYAGDGGPSTLALLNKPKGICVDTAGNLFIADSRNFVIRKVDAATGIISTVAGNHTEGFGGDLGYVDGCNLDNPYGVAVDVYGSIFIADANNQRVRKTYTYLSVGSVPDPVELQVSPNPCSSQVSVSGLTKTDKVNITDAVGRHVTGTWEAPADGTHEFSTQSLMPGMYILQVYGKGGYKKATVKLVKE